MALYRDDELHQAGAANGIAGYGPPSGAFFGSGPKAPSPGLAPSPNSTLISPAVGNGSDAGPGPSTESLILQHLYDSFLSGAYSDLVLRFHGESTSEFHVHKMMVCRSPLIAQMLQQGPMYDLTIPINDPNITSDGLGTCLGSLYSTHARDALATTISSDVPAVHSKYLRSVLASAVLLKLPEIAQLASDLIRADINRGSLLDYIAFTSTPEFAEYYQPFAKEIRDAIFTYLCKLSVREIASLGYEGGANIWGNKGSEAYRELVRLFAELPFEWLKLVVESKNFEVPTDKERHDFARQIIALRAQSQSPNRPQIVAGEENVLLAFGGKDSNKSGVTIVRKARPVPQHQGFGMPRQGLLNGNGVGPMMNPPEGRRIWKIGE